MELGIDWRWKTGKLGQRCDDCGDSHLQGRPVAVEGRELLCTRCAVRTSVSLIARRSPERTPRQLEIAA